MVVRVGTLNELKTVLEGIDALPADLQERTSSSAISSIAGKSFEEAVNLVGAMESGSVKTSSARSAASMWASRDHNAALEWILNERCAVTTYR